MSSEKFRARYLLPVLVALGALPSPMTFAQTAPTAVDEQGAAKPEQPKKKPYDKHAAPWTVIWNTRLWTDAPPAQDFVQATHPDPKTLEYQPLAGKEPTRTTPRTADGVSALQAELEGDVAANAVRGKAVNDVTPPPAAAAAPAPKPAAKTSRSAKAKRNKRTAKAAADAKGTDVKAADAKTAKAN